MMDDRTLLERAAKAAGLRVNFHPTASYQWNPLSSDGDALRLAVKLRLTIEHKESCVNVWDGCIGTGFVPNEDDPYAATRRAITRAAAAMGGE